MEKRNLEPRGVNKLSIGKVVIIGQEREDIKYLISCKEGKGPRKRSDVLVTTGAGRDLNLFGQGSAA